MRRLTEGRGGDAGGDARRRSSIHQKPLKKPMPVGTLSCFPLGRQGICSKTLWRKTLLVGNRAPTAHNPPMASDRAELEQSRRFLAVRAAHRAERAEDYVEAVAAIIARAGLCRICDLARHMGVSHVTVTRAAGRLREVGLIDPGPRRPLTLTPAGRRLARRTQEKHEVVLRFLLHIGVPPRAAALDAEGLEHHVSEGTIRAMRRVLASK